MTDHGDGGPPGRAEHPPDEPGSNAALIDFTQQVAGVLAARHRGDADGVAALMNSFPDDKALAGGALLLADLALGLYREQTGQSMQDCVQELTHHLETVRKAS